MTSETFHQEALLRHLMQEQSNGIDAHFIYSFLLGGRLFLSPHQILTEIYKISNEGPITPDNDANLSRKVCTQCRKIHHTKPEAPSTSSKGTDFRSNDKAGHTTDIIVSAVDEIDGEDTIRRRRKGRRRSNQSETTEQLSLPAVAALPDRSSTLSRDSGILSEVLDLDVMDNENNNRKTPRRNMPQNAHAQINDSGYVMDEPTEPCSQCQVITLHHKNSLVENKKQLVYVLHEWVRHFPADFRNKKIMWTLNDVIKNCQSESEELQSLGTKVVECISRRKATQESYEQQLSDSDEVNTLKRNQNYRKTRDWMTSTITKLTDAADVNEMAQQLCLVEMDYLKHVGAEEFLQLFTADGNEDSRTNLGACVRWFNRLSHLVGTVICMCRKRKHSRHAITFFARVANRCFEISNFNSAMAILTGLSLGPVTRLKRTWNKLKLSELQKLQNVFDPANNFAKYRTIYNNRHGQASPRSPSSGDHKPDVEATTNRYSIISQRSTESATSTCSHQGDSGIECDPPTSSIMTSMLGKTPSSASPRKPRFTFDSKPTQQDGVMVPFLVLMVKDVYFLNHAIPTVHSDGSINFEKLRQLSNLLHPLEEWKKVKSSHRRHDGLQDFLLHAPVLEDEDLYLLSYKREAPTNRFEKQQLKSLRANKDPKKRGESTIKDIKKGGKRKYESIAKGLRRKTM